MARITVTGTVDAPLTKVWDSWDDYGGIARFSSGLNASFLINGSAATGLGAERQCDLADGKNFIQERIVEYVPHRKLGIDIYNGTIPLKNAHGDISFRAMGPNRTEITFVFSFTPPFGPLGLIMLPLLKRQLRPGLAAALKGNKAFVERGVEVARAA